MTADVTWSSRLIESSINLDAPDAGVFNPTDYICILQGDNTAW
jgi:hypothetical protein